MILGPAAEWSFRRCRQVVLEMKALLRCKHRVLHNLRLFHHMGELWKGSTQSMGDVKELIPEFYYLEDMFVNGSCLPLGQRQNGETVSDVVRPPPCVCPVF